MSKVISIEKLSTAEKLDLMEKLWANLSVLPDYTPPAWHKDEVLKRLHAVKEGKENYVDWEKAKKDIRNEI